MLHLGFIFDNFVKELAFVMGCNIMIKGRLAAGIIGGIRICLEGFWYVVWKQREGQGKMQAKLQNFKTYSGCAAPTTITIPSTSATNFTAPSTDKGQLV